MVPPCTERENVHERAGFQTYVSCCLFGKELKMLILTWPTDGKYTALWGWCPVGEKKTKKTNHPKKHTDSLGPNNVISTRLPIFHHQTKTIILESNIPCHWASFIVSPRNSTQKGPNVCFSRMLGCMWFWKNIYKFIKRRKRHMETSDSDPHWWGSARGKSH